jgi:hypothetical protein
VSRLDVERVGSGWVSAAVFERFAFGTGDDRFVGFEVFRRVFLAGLADALELQCHWAWETAGAIEPPARPAVAIRAVTAVRILVLIWGLLWGRVGF